MRTMAIPILPPKLKKHMDYSLKYDRKYPILLFNYYHHGLLYSSYSFIYEAACV